MKQITIEELNAWLDNPITLGFLNFLWEDYSARLEAATRLSIDHFHKNTKNEDVTKLFGESRGIHIAISKIENLIEEFKEVENEEDEKKKEQLLDKILTFINFINKK